MDEKSFVDRARHGAVRPRLRVEVGVGGVKHSREVHAQDVRGGRQPLHEAMVIHPFAGEAVANG